MTTSPTSSRLLLDEPPLQVLPSLAVALGLNEAIIVQQLHYLLRLKKHLFAGVSWIYNTCDQWCRCFPFWGRNTIRRALANLAQQGILVSTTRFNRSALDHPKWYTINYDRLAEVCDRAPRQREDVEEPVDLPHEANPSDVPTMDTSSTHNGQMVSPRVIQFSYRGCMTGSQKR